MRKVSLVSTVFNEINNLENTISDIENQTLKPDEIIITDAGSNDGTFERLMDWNISSTMNIQVLQEKKCNVARGRNLAIAKSANDLILSTDFGCRFSPNWVENMVEIYCQNENKVIGGGFGVLEETLNSISAKANFILTNQYEISFDDYFIPSSRSILYHKNVWNKIGGYCEWLTLAADDLVFGKQIKALGIPIVFSESKDVLWGRHKTAKAYKKESYRYGLGDGEAKVNSKNAILNGVYFLIRILTLVFVTLVLCKKIGLIYLLIVAPFSYKAFYRYFKAFKTWNKLDKNKYTLGTLIFSFYLLEVTTISYSHGFIKGYCFSSKEVKKKAQELNKMLKY
ncbi:MAG: glycosyltransferase [Ignavibacteriae bacterium]|nr:glycosyltransferase [Ignavibacteriota bacterium]MCB0752178.1 glycosyltransferase [Ignavibacteriota bacterium]